MGETRGDASRARESGPPRRAREPHGSSPAPGTSGAPSGALAALFNECVHCGFCLPVCPTYDVLGTEMDSPRGRLFLMRALETGRIAPTEPVVRHLDLCLGCRACESECPSGVQIGRAHV